MQTCGWTAAVFMSAFGWGAADAIFDVVVDFHDDNENVDEEKKAKSKHVQSSLTQAQTMFLCSLTTLIILFLYCLFIMIYKENYWLLLGDSSLFFMNTNQENIYILLLGGVFCYYHYHFIVKAFEHSSSTIILPFLQFSSVFAFVLSMFQKYLLNLPWLSNKLHLFAYFLILIGGLTPATEGNLTQLFKTKFWKQPFVKYALAGDASHAIYTIFVSYVGEGGESVITGFNFFYNMEFFILTRIMFIVVFMIQLLRSKQTQLEIFLLQKKSNSLIVTTMGCEVLTLIGYFSSVYAYQCYYQVYFISYQKINLKPGVVSASESSLNLVINLLLAFVLKRYFNYGRDASLKHITLKIFACILIILGLIIANT